MTVPAGGDAQVTLTADTRIAGPDGYLTGALTAAMGDQTMRTPFAVNKEVESYTLTLAHTATDGSPANAYLTVLQDADFPAAIDGRIQYDPSGTVTVRVAKGRYSLWSVIFPNRSDRSGLPSDQAANLLVQPVLDVDADRSVAVDARLAKASSITVPSASARNVFALFSYLLARPSYPASGGLFSSSFDWIRSGQLGDSGPVEGLTSEIAGTWATLLDNDGLTNRAATYSISHHEFGKTVVGYQRKVAQSELATVTTSYHAGDDKGFSGRWYATARLPGEGESHPPAIGKSFPMPSTITHFFNSDSDAQWQSVVDQIWTDPDGNQDILGEFRGPWTGYQAGRSYAETWNHAVFGPTFPSPGGVSTGVTRTGDTIGVDLPLYGDGAGRDGYGGDSGSVALYRDAVKIGETAEIGGASSPCRPRRRPTGYRCTPTAAYRMCCPPPSTRPGRSDRRTSTVTSRRNSRCWAYGSPPRSTTTMPRRPAAP